MSAVFKLIPRVAQLPEYASRYEYPNEAEAIEVGQRAMNRGHLLKKEFLFLGEWKSNRPRRFREQNTASEVVEATRVALCVESERVRMGVLVSLAGVSWPTASVVLHLCHRDDYPILDFRALWTLGVVDNGYHTFDLWTRYVLACRSLARESGMSMRELDRALWQYSFEHQPSR